LQPASDTLRTWTELLLNVLAFDRNPSRTEAVAATTVSNHGAEWLPSEVQEYGRRKKSEKP
jgi:hypothetical protein